MQELELNKIHNMDCLEGLKQLDDNSVDLIVTDPPYGYSFMGKDWDKVVVGVDYWKECLRVLKDGAFAFVMSAPRSDVQSRLVVNLEDAGFNVGFTPIYWAYASGFPKAGNIGKMVDKKMGAEREVVGINPNGFAPTKSGDICNEGGAKKAHPPLTISSTQQAKALDGSYAGFQPKPAVEVIVVAMKPLSEKTYVEQALKNRKGITWLDDCRVPYESEGDFEKGKVGFKEDLIVKDWKSFNYGGQRGQISEGRFPANLLVSDDVLNNGNVSKGIKSNRCGQISSESEVYAWNKDSKGKFDKDNAYECGYNDSGSFSRYFDLDKWHINRLPKSVQKTFPFLIVPKASSGEKNDGLDEFEKPTENLQGLDTRGRTLEREDGSKTLVERWQPDKDRKNNHPTVKPTKLIEYLITLGSREGDLILDPFMGSGTTAIASRLLSRKFIGFEREKEYHEIATARIKEHLEQKKLFEVT